MSFFNPMPDLIENNNNNNNNMNNANANVNNNGNANANANPVNNNNNNNGNNGNNNNVNQDENGRRGNENGISNGNDYEMIGDESDHLAIETKTTSKTHCINWIIDARSLHIAQLAQKGDKRGVIEANIEKEGHRFKLELCASGWRNSQDGYCAFYLTVQDQDELFVARYRVQVGNISRISSIRHDFHLGVGFPNFCEQSQLESIMNNSQVRFLVTVEIFTCKSNVQTPIKPLSTLNGILIPNDVLSKLMKDMFTKRLHSDVSLVCGNYEIPVHKCVLSHTSAVFRAIFSHNFVENSTNEIRMHDWKPEIVELMIIFLYTARIEDVNEIKKKYLTLEKQHTQILSIDSEDDNDDEISNSNHNNYIINNDIHSMMRTITSSPSLQASPSLSVSEGFYGDIDGRASVTPSIVPNFMNGDINLASLANMTNMNINNNNNNEIVNINNNNNINNNEIINTNEQDIEMKSGEDNDNNDNNKRTILTTTQVLSSSSSAQNMIVGMELPLNAQSPFECKDEEKDYESQNGDNINNIKNINKKN